VFDGLNLDIAPGERLAILGPSEAGKSTLALCLQGLIPRLIKGEFRGRVEVDGCRTAACRPRELAGRVGLLFQDFEAQFVATRVDQELAFGPENLEVAPAEMRRRLSQALALVGLEVEWQRDPASLSGGQKQLLALAATLTLEPQVLVLDEPTSDLDPLRVEALLAALKRLSGQRQLTLVLLGQDLRLVQPCERLVVLDQGRVRADGPAADILRRVELFRELGLRPAALPALFHDLGAAVLPLTLDEALPQARRQRWGPGAWPPEPHSPSDAAAPEILALRQVTFAYAGAAPVLRDFSLSFSAGELTAILGPNGGGKSTVLKLLRGLLPPQAGQVWQAPGPQGAPLRVGFVFQNPDYQLFAEEVWEEVAFGPRQLGLPAGEVDSRVTHALSQVHLLERARDDPFSLTKGQRQRLAVAGVLALAPQVIILDEPTTGLDYRECLDLLDLVAELHQHGHTIIMVTHSMWAAAAYAWRLVVIYDVRVVV
jgi:energy-coupling factor transport system ATP-binding protein